MADKIIVDSPSLGYRIDRLFAYVALDDEGEGVVSMTMPGLGTVPFVGADSDRMLSLRPQAQLIAKQTGKQVKLIRFDTRTEVEVIDP